MEMCICIQNIWIIIVRKPFWVANPIPFWEPYSLQGSCLLATALQNTKVHEEKEMAFSYFIPLFKLLFFSREIC